MPVPDLYNNSTYQGDTITDKIQNRLAELNKATPFTFSNNVLNTVKNVSSPFAQPVNTTDNSSTLSVYYTGNTIQNKIQNRLNELKETTNPFAISQNVFKIAKEKVSDFFKPSPTKVRARDVLRESGGIISGGIKRGAEFITEQAIKTKESAPFIPEAARETFTKPELYGEFMVRGMAELDKSAVSVLNLVNKINPTYGIKPLQTAKQKIGDTLESIKKSFMLPEPTTTTSGIISAGAKLTADFQKYAILDRGIKALFTPLATVFAKYKPETATHLFNDAAMKAEMSGYDEIATQFFKVAKNIPKNPTEQIRLFTRISSQVKDLKFKGQLLGGMKEMARRASGEMAELALKEPAFVKSGMFELVKQLPEAARVFSNIGSLVALGQIDFEEGQGSRANQVLLDIAIGAAFEGAGVLVKRLSPSAKKIFEDIQQGVNTPLKNAEELAREIKSSQAGEAKPAFSDLTTNVLKKFKTEDLVKTHPVINLKKTIPITDIYGTKKVIPVGEALTPYELKGNKYLLKDGGEHVVSKNQYQNIKGQSTVAEGKPFAPELQGTEETILGKQKGDAKKAMEITRKAFADFDAGKITREERNKILDTTNNIVPQDKSKYSQYQLPSGRDYKEIIIKAPEVKGQPTFTSSHYPDEKNPISHLRVKIYDDPKAGQVTFIEEMQSDWAAKGRREGFANFKKTEFAKKEMLAFEKQIKQKYNEEFISPNLLDKMTSAEVTKWRELTVLAKEGAIPNNPLLKNWQELSVKRALKEAVDNSSDYLAWISGEQTSARYNLATYLDSAKWNAGKTGVKKIELKPKTGEDIVLAIDKKGEILTSSQNKMIGKKLDEVLGKGLADKIMEKETGQLSGEGLAFGGEWAKNLYDKQLKNIVEDVTGGKVEVLDMGLPIEKSKQNFSIGTTAFNPFGKSDIKVGTVFNKGIRDTNHIIVKKLEDESFEAVNISDNAKKIINKVFKTPDEIRSFYFKPGRKVPSYGGGLDEVVEYIPSTKNKGWEVKVKELDTDYVRTHATQPEQKNILNEMIADGKITQSVLSDLPKKTFDLSQKTTIQQAIKLTPKIKARIRGEVPTLKQPSGALPFGKAKIGPMVGIGAGTTGVLATIAALKEKNKEANAKTYAEKIASVKIPASKETTKEIKPLLGSKWAEAVFQAESSGGTNRKNEFNDAGKFGWLVGFTKGTYNGIVAKAKAGDKRYIDLLKKINLDTEKGAKQSAVEYANFKNTLFNNKGNPIGKKYTDPVDIYVNIYNASGNRNAAKNNFLKYYNQK